MDGPITGLTAGRHYDIYYQDGWYKPTKRNPDGFSFTGEYVGGATRYDGRPMLVFKMKVKKGKKTSTREIQIESHDLVYHVKPSTRSSPGGAGAGAGAGAKSRRNSRHGGRQVTRRH